VVATSSLSYASAATPDSPDQKPPWLTQMVAPFGDTAGRPDGDDQGPGDGAVGPALGHQRQHLALAEGPAPPGRVAARRTDALHEVTGADTADADAERADTDPGTPDVHTGQWTADGWTSPARTPDGHTGHRTLDTGRGDETEHPDSATSARRHPDRHPGPPRPPDCPLGRRTVDL
jgi:hypothetical protein